MASYFKEKPQQRRTQSTWQRLLPIFGLVFILLFFGSMLWSSSEYSNQAIIGKYFEPTLSENNKNITPDILNNNTIANPKHLESQYLLGEYYYKNNTFTKSIESYDFVLKNKNNTAYEMENVNFETAKWNQTLMLLGNNERNKAIESLNEIIASNYSEKYKSDAKVLKEKLNSFWYGWAN